MPLTTGMLLAMLKKQEQRIKILEDKFKDDCEVVYYPGGDGTYAPSVRLKSKTSSQDIRDNGSTV